MNTPPSMRYMNSAESILTSDGQVAGERLASEVTLLAMEQVLAELGSHVKHLHRLTIDLSDIVAKAQSIENGIIQSRSRRKPEQMC